MSIPPAALLDFDFFAPLPIQIEVSDAPLTSDAGLLPLRQFDERIGLAPLGVGREVALGDEVLEQEAPDPWPEQGVLSHGYPPFLRSARSAHWPLPAAQASCSGRLAWRPTPHAPGRPTAGAATSAHRAPADTRTPTGEQRRCAAGRAAAAGSARRPAGRRPPDAHARSIRRWRTYSAACPCAA